MKVTDAVNPVKAKKTPKASDLTNHIAIVLDVSGSMSHLLGKLAELTNKQINEIKLKAHESGQVTYVSIYAFDRTTKPIVMAAHPEAVPYITEIQLRRLGGGDTALKDALLRTINDLSVAKNADDPMTSFLVLTLTDGQENCSRGNGFSGAMERVRKTDRWSIAFMAPPGSTGEIMQLGIPLGNIQEWEGTERGLEQAFVTNNAAIGNYMIARGLGSTSTQALYTDLSGLTSKDLQKLDDRSSDFRRIRVEKEDSIADFCKKKLGDYPIGRAYYELTKTEKVQDHKKLVIQDRTSNKIYGGAPAKSLIGITSGPGVVVKVTPRNHSNYRIFVNSTSTNRKLVRGTDLLVEK